MKFKPGDVVIKNTGGNKMSVFTASNNECECIWVTDKVNQDTFSENDLLTIDEYKKSLKVEEREDIINEILSFRII